MKSLIFLLLTATLLALPYLATAQSPSSITAHYYNYQIEDSAEQESTDDKGIKKGDKALISHSQTVSIVNLDPIMNPSYNADCGASRYLFYGDDCRIRQYGSIKIVGVEDYLVLARYTEPTNIYETSPRGTCPSGTLFFISKWRFESMVASHDETLTAKETEEEEKRLIKRLIEDE